MRKGGCETVKDILKQIQSKSGNVKIFTSCCLHLPWAGLNSLRPSDEWRIYVSVNWPPLVQIMACRLAGAKPLSEQCCNIVNSNLRNNLQWNLKWNSYIFIQENAFENVCEMAAILSWPQCVKNPIGPTVPGNKKLSRASVGNSLTGPPVRGRKLWRRTGNFLLIILQFHVYDLSFKAWGPTTFLTEF